MGNCFNFPISFYTALPPKNKSSGYAKMVAETCPALANLFASDWCEDTLLHMVLQGHLRDHGNLRRPLKHSSRQSPFQPISTELFAVVIRSRH